MQTLTDRQMETYVYMIRFLTEYHTVPRVKDICYQFNITANAVVERLDMMKRKGWIDIYVVNGKPRYRLTNMQVIVKCQEL